MIGGSCVFGELRTEYSRAFFDEEDQDDCVVGAEENFSMKFIKNEKNQDVNFPAKFVIVTDGDAATGFADCYFGPKSSVIGHITAVKSPAESLLFSHSYPQPKSTIYRIGKDTVVVSVAAKLLPEQTFSWFQQLLLSVDCSSSTFLVLCCRPYADYHSLNEEHQAPVLRSLHTRAFVEDPGPPKLEAPNTLSGVSAAVLNYSQAHSQPAVCYILYSDTVDVDSISVDNYKCCLQLLTFRDIPVNPDLNRRLCELSSKVRDRGNLYI